MAIELRSVTKRVGVETHIYNTSLALEEGRFNVLLGTTLSGKTTFLRLMAGLERPSTGEVWFKGRNVTGVPVQRRNVAMVYQQFINYPNFTVFDNIASPLRVTRTPKPEIEKRVKQVAELLQITPMLQRMPSELSGGQQQRTALARALVKDAELVLLDEPLANLDYKLREEFRAELPKLFLNSGATVVYATTEPAEALLLGGYTATLHQGGVTQFGPTPSVYREPRDLISAQVFSDPPINSAPIHKRGERFYLSERISWDAGQYSALADGDYIIGFRPHHIGLSAVGDRAVEVDARVVITEISGSESVIHASVDEHIWVSLSPGIHRLTREDEIKLYIQVDRCFYFDTDHNLIPGQVS